MLNPPMSTPRKGNHILTYRPFLHSAIIYQCIRVLSRTPSHYISELIEDGKEPFRAVHRFVAAQNHILKYLGLRCLSLMDYEFWDEEWHDGKVISEAIAISNGDETLVDEVR